MVELHQGEKILLKKHRFWLPFAAESAAFFVAALMPLAVMAFAGNLPAGINAFVSDHRPLLWLILTSWSLIMWIAFFIAWTNYYLDILLVTNKRVVDVEQIGLFARDIAEMRIENIQDTKVEVIGLLASLFNFGNVHIQTAGVNKEFVVKHIHDPHGAKDVIAKAHDELARS